MSVPEVKEVKNKDGTLAFKCWDTDGSILPLTMQNPDAKLKEINELEYKEGDIIIVSYPKAGTNWLKDSLSMLLNGSTNYWFAGTMFDYGSLDGYKNQGSRRIALSHLRPAHFSDSHKVNAKFILVVRNPKDVAVSLFYHLGKVVGVEMQATWDQFFELFVQNQVPYGSFFDHYRAWQEFIQSNIEHVLVVYYEDMHKDYKKELQRIADFVDVNVSDDIMTKISEKGQQMQVIHDEKMKQPDIQAKLKLITNDGSFPFYRKGQVGDWKNHFTVAQNDIYGAIIEKEMDGLMFKFDYLLK